jgi:hypothetical protein
MRIEICRSCEDREDPAESDGPDEAGRHNGIVGSAFKQS